jgi:ABC-type transport system involved in multi-copper enzyme maturation permease subunit
MMSTIKSSTEIPTTDPVTSPALIEKNTFTVDLDGKVHLYPELKKTKTTADISATTSAGSDSDVHSLHCIDIVTYKPVECGKEGSGIIFPDGTVAKYNVTGNITLYIRQSANIAKQISYSDSFPWWVIAVAIIGVFFLVGIAYAIFRQRGKMYQRSYTVNRI